MVAVAACATMAGDVLDDREHAASSQSPRDRKAQGCHRPRFCCIGPITDNVMGARNGHVQHRGTVCIETQLTEVIGQKAIDEFRRSCGHRYVASCSVEVSAACGEGAPQRRAQTLNTAALLVDQGQDVFSANCIPDIPDQPADLVMLQAVTREQYDAGGTRFAQKLRLCRLKLGSGQSGDEGETHRVLINRS